MESIEAFFNHFHGLLDELQEADEHISDKSTMRLFFLLGPEFEMLQNLYSIENLPAKWKTQDWPTLLVLCHNYFNSVYSKGVIIDCIAQQKKVKKWFLNPSKHCRGIES